MISDIVSRSSTVSYTHLGFERIALAGERDLRFCVGVLLAGRTQKAHPDKIEDFLLRLREG